VYGVTVQAELLDQTIPKERRELPPDCGAGELEGSGQLVDGHSAAAQQFEDSSAGSLFGSPQPGHGAIS
jgi:hypothetical protein